MNSHMNASWVFVRGLVMLAVEWTRLASYAFEREEQVLMNPSTRTFGDLLRQHRLAANLSQGALAGSEWFLRTASAPWSGA